MDTMDILMDMAMDIMVDKHNNQNAKIGLERTPELSSSNFNQKMNSTRLFVQDQRMSKVHSKIYNFSYKKTTMQLNLERTQLKYELLTVKNVICYR